MSHKVFTVPDQAIVTPITIVPELCTGCNLPEQWLLRH